MEGKQVIGAVLTIGGLLLMAYGVVSGLMNGSIGSKEALTSDAVAIVVGWFAILIGPALWLGETPAAVRARAGR